MKEAVRRQRAGLADAVAVTRRIRRRFAASIKELDGFRATAAWMNDPDEAGEKDVDAFLKRFEQLYDYAAKQVLRLGLLANGETVAGMSARDAFDRAEALGAGTPAEDWMAFAAIRNELAHAYSIDPVRRADRVNGALEAAPALLAAVDDMMDLWRRRGLLEGESR